MRKSQSGMSLAEVIVGLAILSIMILTTVTTTTTALKLTKNNTNKEFGTQKAISMLEELRSLVQTASGTTLTFLDAYDDGTKNRMILTTQGQLPELVTEPDDLISGNIMRNGKWLYERRISVQPVPGQGNDVRFVNVKVYINEDGGQRLLAEVASVLRTLVVDMPPTQVYDVYAIAIENVPGWWVYMSNIVPFVRTTISDLQARNPGLIFRMHWIHTLAYGRDQQYKPYTNDASVSTADINWAYFYPGKMPEQSDVGDDYYYPWFLFRGVMNHDGTVENDFEDDPEDLTYNPWPYAIADMYNNAMRYPDEVEHWFKRNQSFVDTDKPAEEPTWRMLIEAMYSNPSDFTNAIVINLHGELLPFPPVRNYSDAAKSPEDHPNIRAVTHPEQLRYTNDDDVKLRVYTYRMDPDSTATGSNYMGESGINDVPVTVRILGTVNNWNPGAGAVKIIRGGTDQDGVAGVDLYDATPVDAPTTASGNRAYWERDTTKPDQIVLKLHKSPLKHKQDGNGGGLHRDSRLYGLEYIPAPLENLTDTSPADQFKRHLGTTCCAQIQAFRDTFSTNGSYTKNNGSLAFENNWQENNEDGSASSGFTRVESNRLRIGDNGSGSDTVVWREANLAGYDRAHVSFHRNSSNLESSDQLRFDVYDGSDWHELETYAGNGSVYEEYDITAYMHANTRFRFTPLNYNSNSSGSNYDYFYVDNFQVEVSKLGNLPKNTARWIITIPKAFLPADRMLTIETRIGDTIETGVMYPEDERNDPPNLSRTYVWRGTDEYIFGDADTDPALPVTEQFQFIGDPRHVPYADLKRPHIGAGFTGFENRLGMGYNRYHDDFEAFGSGDLTSTPILTSRDSFSSSITFDNTTRTFAVIVNGVTPVSVELPTGTGQSLTAIANTLNANAQFTAVAFADVSSNRLRIRSKSKGGSIQYDNETGKNGAIFGFEGGPLPANSASVDTFSFTTGTPWPGWNYTGSDGKSYGVKNDGNQDNDTWHNIEFDVPRAFQMLRSGLIQSNTLWTTMTGFSYYYMGIGNEIGYDAANNFPNSIPVSSKPFTGSGGSRYEQTIIDTGVKYIRQQNDVNGWWALHWIGELYPDSEYDANSNWMENGNLRAGAGSTYFIRDRRDSFKRFKGTQLERSERRTGPRGSTTLFWGESTTSAFQHTSVGDSESSTLTDDGKDIRDHFALPVPETIPTNRPWSISSANSGDFPENFLHGAYAAPRKIQYLQHYFTRTGTPNEGSALVAMTDPLYAKPAFIIVNGLSPTGITGTTFIAKWSFLTLIQSFLNGGKFTDGETYSDPDGSGPMVAPSPGSKFHIRQLPRVVITHPNQNTPLKDPGSVRIAWEEKWTRWDGQRYSRAYPEDCEDTTAGCYSPENNYKRKYVVLYSPSNGTPDPENGNPTGWFYTDGDSAKLGERNLTKAINNLEYQLLTPKATFPEGNYLFRVEVYREGYPQHYSFHQYRAYIQRQ